MCSKQNKFGLLGQRNNPVSATAKKKSAKMAFAWVSIGRIAARSLAVLQLLFIGKVAGPEAFTALAFPLIVLNLLETFTEQGLGNAVIQKPGAPDEYLPTVYCINVLRGVFLGLILVVGAGYVPERFIQPGSENIFLGLAVVPAIKGLENLANVVLPKRLDFRPLVVLEFIAALAGLLVTFSTWFLGCGLWSLIWGKIAVAIVSTCGSFVLLPRFHGISFSFERYRELHRFGIWVMASRYASTALTKGGALVVAALLPAIALSYYQYADLLATTIVLEIARVTNRVAFPAYSNLQDDTGKLAVLFSKSFIMVSFVVFAIVAYLSAVSEEMVLILLNEEWLESAPLIPFIALWGASRSLGSCLTSLLMAVGRPGAAAAYQYLMLGLVAVGIYPAAEHYGALGICYFAGRRWDGCAIIQIPTGSSLNRYRYEIPFSDCCNAILCDGGFRLLHASVIGIDRDRVRLVPLGCKTGCVTVCSLVDIT